jgi:hypothetical protein
MRIKMKIISKVTGLAVLGLMIGCSSQIGSQVQNTIGGRIKCPEGYTRIHVSTGSFAEWMRTLPLKDNSDILDYTGQKIDTGFSILAVINLPLLFKADLEQCADWAMRFWYEYHIVAKRTTRFWLVDYEGRKILYSNWLKSHPKSNLKQFFRKAAEDTNSYSLRKGLTNINDEKQLLPGDVFVQNNSGGIGHVSIIFDVCENKPGDRLYLFGYSFMPAQQAHIEKPGVGYGVGDWFTYAGCVKHLQENYGGDVKDEDLYIIGWFDSFVWGQRLCRAN